MDQCKSANTPMSATLSLYRDINGKSVDQKSYKGMIGSLLYLTTSRPDIMFSVCLCAHFQANPKESHLTVVKRILRYLHGSKDFGLWYLNSGNFALIGFSNTDNAFIRWIERALQDHVNFLDHH